MQPRGMLSTSILFAHETTTTAIYTLSLHDALPICTSVFQCPFCHGWEMRDKRLAALAAGREAMHATLMLRGWADDVVRSEEHTSELQSRRDLVCRLLLEKKKKHRVSTRPPTGSPAC